MEKETKNLKGFNVRVYGICIDNNQILISDEFRIGMRMAKFPGGGLILGEGTRDCLKREIVEEMGEEIIVGDHIYTTDYFQPALYMVDSQLISVYYFFSFVNTPSFKISNIAFDFEEIEGNQSFRWLKIETLSPDDLTLPIDKKVVKLLRETL